MYVTTCIIVLISTYALIKYFFVENKNKFQNIYNRYSDTDDTDDTEEVEDAEDAGETGEAGETEETDETEENAKETGEAENAEETEENHLPEEVNDLDVNKKHQNLINTIKSINESYDQQK